MQPKWLQRQLYCLQEYELDKKFISTKGNQDTTMSSRALRRLEQQRLKESQEAVKSDVEGNESDEGPAPAQSKFNAFALLNGESESDVSEAEEEKEPVTVKAAPKPKKSKKKKNKKIQKVDSDDELDKILAEVKRKDQERALLSKEVSHTPEVQEYGEEEYNFEEEYDLVTEPVVHYDSNFKYFTTQRLKKCLPLLSINKLKNLDPDQEFKNLFGNLSLDTIEDANTTTSLAISPEVLQQFKRLARLTRGWGGKDRRGVPGTSRKLLLSRIRDDWLPTAQKPMTMEEIRTDELVSYFAYKEDTVELDDIELKLRKESQLGVKYFKFDKISNVPDRVANTRFYASVVMTPDPESLMQLIQQNPYHPETLLQVAMVLLRQGNDKSTSNSLIEKALFVFDRSFHKKLHELMSEGKTELIRLPFERFLNRQFYVCLFRFITGLGERRTFFTALSYSKLLWSLSPAEDPIGVRYFIDFYAIMSEEYKYLINLAQSPLCTTYEKWLTPGIAFSSVLAYLHLDDKEGAKKQLEVAYDRHPYTAVKLLEVIGLSTSVPVTESEIDASAENIMAAETYLVRAAIIWNEQDKRQFLHDELIKLFQTKPVVKQQKSFKSSIYSLFGVQDTKTSKDIPFNLIRFAILSGENKIMAKLPDEVWSRDDVLEYDILPPKDSLVEYNEFTGVVSRNSGVTDSLLDYVDHNLLGTIVQSRTAVNDFDEIIRQMQEENPEQDVLQIQ